MDENTNATNSAVTLEDACDSGDSNADNTKPKSKLVSRSSLTEIDTSFPSKVAVDQNQSPVSNGSIWNGLENRNVVEQNKKTSIDSEEDNCIKNNTSASEGIIKTELANMRLQDKNGPLKPEVSEEDNLHGLAIPAEDCAISESNAVSPSVESRCNFDLENQNVNDSCENHYKEPHSHKRDDDVIAASDIEHSHKEGNDVITASDIETNETLAQKSYDKKETMDGGNNSTQKLALNQNKDDKEKLDQEVKNMMHKNIEKFSPKKEPKFVSHQQFTKISNSSIKISERPQRVNPFNHENLTTEVSEVNNASIWQMQQPGPSLSMSLQDLSTYNQQPHPHFKPVNYSASEHSFVPHQMPHNQTPPGYNLPYPQNFSPFPQTYIGSQFDLMPPSTRVRPTVENLSYFEDVDSIVHEAKIRKSREKPKQSLSDPWVKMDELPDDSVPPNAESANAPDDLEHPSVRLKDIKADPALQINQVREMHSAAIEQRKKDAPSSSSFQESQGRIIPHSASLVRPLIEAAGPCEPEDLIEGIIFTAHYLGSTQLQSERNPGKNARMMQAQEAVGRIKAPEGESQPSVEVDLFISTDKVKILNADTQETIMDHTLRSISYIADIGKLLVIMAKRRAPQSDVQDQNQIVRDPKPQRSYRVICHVFSSHDAQLMAQAIGQAFNVAYQQFLTANGIEPQTLTKDDYNQLLDMQEMYHDDLVHYSKRENIKDIWVEKNKGENLGVVIVESGWGSIVPTVILANLQHGGPAERCGKLSIGDQIMTVNGTSLVGLPLPTCQSIIKGLKSQSIARLNIISCPPVVTVLIKRPDLKYQLGFSVQDGIICSLMRGGIAERGGVRVGHRIIEINNQSVVATPHERIVQTLVSSVGEIQMKTMPAMMYRLLTGQEQPIYI